MGIIVGNVASYASTFYLMDSDYRPDAIKVGIGPGSICTTRHVSFSLFVLDMTRHFFMDRMELCSIWLLFNDRWMLHFIVIIIIIIFLS